MSMRTMKLWAFALMCCASSQLAHAQEMSRRMNSADAADPASAMETSTTSTNSTGCQSCQPSSCCSQNYCCCDPWKGVYAGAEAVFIAPMYNNNTSSSLTFADPGGVGSFTVSTATPGASNMGFAPRVWLGAAGENGWGVRGTFFELNNSATSTTGTIGTASFATGRSSLFNMYAIDAEVTKQIILPRSVALTSFGARNGGIRHNENINVYGFAPTTGNVVSGSASTGSQFFGTGLTGATQWYRPMYQGKYGNVGFYGMYRGSVLWGNDQSTTAQRAFVGTGAFARQDNLALGVSNANTMYVNEVQLGPQWSKTMPRWHNNRVFARFTLEYQNWSVNNGSTAVHPRVVGAGIPGTTGVIFSNANANALQNLNLVGFGVSTGCYW